MSAAIAGWATQGTGQSAGCYLCLIGERCLSPTSTTCVALRRCAMRQHSSSTEAVRGSPRVTDGAEPPRELMREMQPAAPFPIDARATSAKPQPRTGDHP